MLAASAPAAAQGSNAASTHPAATDPAAQNYVHALERERDIREIESRIQERNTGWFEILTSLLMGFFSLIVTVAVIFLALRTKDAAIEEAKNEARKEISEEKAELKKLIAGMEAKFDEVVAKVADIEAHRTRVVAISAEVENTAASLLAGGAPSAKAVADLEKVSETIEGKPVRYWSRSEFQVKIGSSISLHNFQQAADLSVAMRQLFNDPESVAISLVSQAYALEKLDKVEESIAILDDFAARFEHMDTPDIQPIISNGLYNRGVILGKLGRREEERAVYLAIENRFAASKNPEIRKRLERTVYNIACSLALTHEVETSIERLRDWARRRGSFDCSKVRDDSDFDGIRGDPRFVALLAEKGCDPQADGAEQQPEGSGK